VVMEQGRLAVEVADGDEWEARLPQGRAGSVSAQNAATRRRMWQGSLATGRRVRSAVQQ